MLPLEAWKSFSFFSNAIKPPIAQHAQETPHLLHLNGQLFRLICDTCFMPLQNRLILDLINEPDAYGASWTASGQLQYNVGTYYLDAMDALYAVCTGCLFQIQGSGIQ